MAQMFMHRPSWHQPLLKLQFPAFYPISCATVQPENQAFEADRPVEPPDQRQSAISGMSFP
jgi:hypothetical protein